MWNKIRKSCWTKIIGGGLLLSVGAAFIADGLDDYIAVGGGQFVRDHDEGFILIGVFLATLGLLILLKGGKAYLSR